MNRDEKPLAFSRGDNYPQLLLGLALLGIALHWPLALSDHTFWDGSLYVSMARSDDLAGTYFPFRDSGQPAYGLYFYLLSFLPQAAVALFDHLFSLVAILSLAILLFAFVRNVFDATPLLALIPAVSALVYPSAVTSMSAVMTPTFIAQALILALGLIHWRAVAQGSMRPLTWGLTLGAMIITTSSSGFVPQYYMVTASVSLVAYLKGGRHNPKSYVPISVCFWGLPALIWTLNRWIYPASAKYTDYNAILPLPKIVRHIGSGFKEAMTNTVWPAHPVSSASLVGCLIVIGLFAAYALSVVRKQQAGDDQGMRGLVNGIPLKKSVLVLAVWFVALGALGVLPYSAVGKVPDPNRWTMRWAIPSEPYFITAFALGIVLLCLALPRKLQSFTSLVLVVSFLSLKGATLQGLNFQLWLRESQEEALIEQLKPMKDELLAHGKVCLSQDLDGAVLKERLRPYEVASLMYQAYGGEMRGWLNRAWDDGYSTKEAGARRIDLLAGDEARGDCVRIATRTPTSLDDSEASVVVSAR